MEIKHGTTPWEYRKCLKRPEGACEACQAVEAAYKDEYRARKAVEGAESIVEAMELLPERGGWDELSEQRWMLDYLTARLYQAKSPRDIAGLVGQRREVVARIAELERLRAADSGGRVSPLDEIARRRAERLDRAAG